MMTRSPVESGRSTRKKTENARSSQQRSNTPGDDFQAPKVGQGQRAKSVSARESDTEVTVDNSATPGPLLASADKSPNFTGDGKTVHKLDDGVFKPFGSRSRASSQCSEAGSDASFCKGGPGKLTCGEPVRHTDDGVQCEKCELWFHITCQEIPKKAYEALKKYKVLCWCCAECRDTLKVPKKDSSAVLTALEGKVDQLDKNIKDHLGKMVQCLREQERSVDQQTKMIERSIRESGTQKVTYAEMLKGSCSEVVEQVSAKLSTFPKLGAAPTGVKDVQNMSRVFDNFLDKDKRKCNLVIHNLPEADAASLAERSEQDTRDFQKMVRDTFKLQVRATRSFRVGKATADRPRLLIVTLESTELKHDLLQLAPQLRNSKDWGNIYISPDLTKTEREAARKLREELKARKAAGEEDLYIKKGRIVSSQGRRVGSTDADAHKLGSGEPNGSDSSAHHNTGPPREEVGHTGDDHASESRQSHHGPVDVPQPSKRQA